ncbi:MAG: hypothetical protein IJH70_14970 [Oscillospiraceae bacterium]|nr:hypothetical protein [Oscillospiraceae bacterium]
MTNQEFYRQLTQLASSNSTATQMPALILKAHKEHLCIPVVYMGDSRDADPAVLIAQCLPQKSFHKKP